MPTTIPGRRLDELPIVVPDPADYIIAHRPGGLGVRFTVAALYGLFIDNIVDVSGEQLISRAGRDDLRARLLHADREFMYLSFFAAPNDGNGGVYIFDAISTAADVGLPDVVKPNDILSTDPGRWIRTNNPT